MQPNIAVAVRGIILRNGINAYRDHLARFVGSIEDCTYEIREVSKRESGMVTRNIVPTTSSNGVLAAPCAKTGYKAAASKANSKRTKRPNQSA